MSEPMELAAEIEAKFIEIDKEALHEKLKQLGGKLLQKEILMRKTIFYTDDHSFARVRDEGKSITMSYKRYDEISLSGVKEVCLQVDSYEAAVKAVAQKLGFDFGEAMFGGIDEVYKLYFDVTNDEVNQYWAEIKFDDGKVPDWLEAKRLRRTVRAI